MGCSLAGLGHQPREVSEQSDDGSEHYLAAGAGELAKGEEAAGQTPAGCRECFPNTLQPPGPGLSSSIFCAWNPHFPFLEPNLLQETLPKSPEQEGCPQCKASPAGIAAC